MSTLKVDNVTSRADSTPYIPGMILQVVTVTTPVNFNTTATTFVTTGLSATLTPKSISSKFLITLQGTVSLNNAQAQGNAIGAQFKFYRSGEYLDQLASYSNYAGVSPSHDSAYILNYDSQTVNVTVIDEPATTNEITYHVDTAADSGANYMGWNSAPAGTSTSTGHVGPSGQLIVMEIAG